MLDTVAADLGGSGAVIGRRAVAHGGATRWMARTRWRSARDRPRRRIGRRDERALVDACSLGVARPRRRNRARASRWSCRREKASTRMVPGVHLCSHPTGLTSPTLVGRRHGSSCATSDSLTSRPLAGTEQANNPVFSPDGRWIGFATGTGMSKVPADGGPVVRIANGGARFAWTPDGSIVFTTSAGGFLGGLWRVSADGGTPEEIAAPHSALQRRSRLTHRAS